MAVTKKLGAYICKGCGIADRLDIKQLVSTATRDCKMNVVKEHDFLCNSEGVSMIQADIDAGEVDHIMIAGCSKRAKTDAFNFDNIAMSRANLREGVIWVRPDSDDAQETTQEMADDYIRMACAEVKFMTVPASSGEQGRTPHVLVVGGGFTGLKAAVEVNKAGYEATIVEKSGALGGTAAQLYKSIPGKSPFADPKEPEVIDLIKQVESNAKINVHLNANMDNIGGAPGRFNADININGETVSETFGSIIQATGFTPYDASQLPEFAYGKSPDIVDQLGLEALAKAANGGAIKRPSDGKEVENVVFVQCVGQRSEKEGHLSYCSGHCCLTSVKQAMYFKDNNPEVDAMVLYTELRMPGAGGEDFYRSGQDKGITFTKGQVSEVVPGTNVTVKFQDLILNEAVELEADLVVLATGMVSNSGVNIETCASEDDNAEAAATNKEQSVLNLDYRQGRDMPQLINGFTDSHFICFPYETQRTGIYSAGPVRRPMDMVQATEDATGAALKAIQAIENAAIGRAAHPRSGDLSFPSFRKEGCTQCKRCTVECPFGAINEDEQRYPLFNEARCRRCGTCMGACPVRVISFENYSTDTVGQALKSVDMPDEFDEKPRILLLACENDAYPALDMAGMTRQEYSAFVRIMPVRCLGSVNTIWISDALNSGYDGIILMGCQKGENYQCHFVKGSEMAHYRMSKIGDTLQQLNLEVERVQTYEISITDIHKVPKIINDMAATIEKIGMNPFKF